jgi:hypothetical protein
MAAGIIIGPTNLWHFVMEFWPSALMKILSFFIRLAID